TPHLVEHTEVVDTLSWSRDSRRLVYIAGGEGRAELRILDVESRRSEAIRGATGRVPAWSPTQDVIAVVRATNGVATAHFISPAGAEQRAPVPIASVGSPLSIAWSPDGQRLALINLPGRNLAEVWVLDLRSAELHRVVGLPAPSDLSGATWSPDGRSLILGRVEFDNEVLLIEGLPKL
ncbi:MAG TPA: LpqB family beta-propeller domain-containing protein, partial [Thermoanaerobaculia bacterium]|nr:LpqB family beta-propeller domain-containing protein [Thermoanaerobaculia bacterium]